MKKLNLLIALLAVAMIGFMTSCEDEAVGPSIVLTSDGITADQEVTAGGTFTVAWMATKGDANLASLTITRDDVDLSGYPDEDIEKDNYAGTATITVLSTPAVYVYKIIVTDADGLTDAAVLNITVVAAAGGDLKTTFSVTLGAQSNPVGSFCNAYAGTIWLKGQAIANKDNIDFIYYVGDDNGPFIAGPSDSDIQTITWSGTINWTNWTSPNVTNFTNKLAAADYNDATYASVATVVGSASATQTINLVANDVVGFKTDAGKYGIFKVTSITPTAAGTISIEIKIQE